MARVLIVLDGSYRFTETGMPLGASDFTYMALLDALTSASQVSSPIPG